MHGFLCLMVGDLKVVVFNVTVMFNPGVIIRMAVPRCLWPVNVIIWTWWRNFSAGAPTSTHK